MTVSTSSPGRAVQGALASKRAPQVQGDRGAQPGPYRPPAATPSSSSGIPSLLDQTTTPGLSAKKKKAMTENKLKKYLAYKEKVRAIKAAELAEEGGQAEGGSSVPRLDQVAGSVSSAVGKVKQGGPGMQEAMQMLNNTVQQYIGALSTNQEALKRMDRSTLVQMEQAVTGLASQLQSGAADQAQGPDLTKMLAALGSLDPNILAQMIESEPELQGINLDGMLSQLQMMQPHK